MKCCFWCLEKCLRYLNKNAYIGIAIYGKNFCKAAKDAFFLLLRNALRLGRVLLGKDTCISANEETLDMMDNRNFSIAELRRLMALQLFYCSWEDCSSLELLVGENNPFYSKTCLSVLTNLDFDYRCGKFLLVWQICQWCWRCPTFLFCCSYCGKFNVIFLPYTSFYINYFIVGLCDWCLGCGCAIFLCLWNGYRYHLLLFS